MNSIIVGVSGGSGSGKTTFCKKVCEILGENNATLIYQDSYYFDQSDKFDFDGGRVNFDHPNSIEFSLLKKHLEELKINKSVQVPHYEFSTHKRTFFKDYISPKEIIFVDGILIFHPIDLKNVFDLKVFFDTKEEVRYLRRLERDVKERGRSPEGVNKQFLSQVKPMHDLFVDPCKLNSDLIYDGEQSIENIVRDFLSRLDSDFNFKLSESTINKVKNYLS